LQKTVFTLAFNLFFPFLFLKVAITWKDKKQEELQQEHPFNIEHCKFTLLMPFVEKSRNTYFLRQLEHEVGDGKMKTAIYFDFAVITMANKEFQHFQCSMKFDNTFYSLFSGQSKKVRK